MIKWVMWLRRLVCFFFHKKGMYPKHITYIHDGTAYITVVAMCPRCKTLKLIAVAHKREALPNEQSSNLGEYKWDYDDV